MAETSSNSAVKDDDIRILLDRRAEILAQVNKLHAEYYAIAHILDRLRECERPTGAGIDIQIRRLQKLKAEEAKYDKYDDIEEDER